MRIKACILSLAVLLTACSSIDCQLNGTVYCHFEIQSEDGQSATLTIPLSVTLNRAATYGDTVYINSQDNVSQFDVPLSYAANTDKITLTLHNGTESTIQDTVSITKTNEPYFESADCAPRFNHTLENVSSTNNFIKEIIINDSKVSNNANVTNIYIRVISNN